MTDEIDRRRFMQSVAFGAGMTSSWTAHSYAAIPGANERLRIGVIGCGGMGNAHIRALLNMRDSDNIEIVAVSDVYQKRLDAAAEKTGGKPFARYRDLLSQKDVDSVVIATPEHWHHRMIVDAIDADKHIYAEKPMTYTVKQAKDVARRVQRSQIKMQVGVQGMSDETYEVAQRYIKEGALGKIVMAQIDYSRNHADDFWLRKVDPDARPGENLDWESFLGPAPKRPWDPQRFFSWRRYWDYCGGIATDLFVHRVSRIIKSVGLTFPERVVATGDTWQFTQTAAEIPDTFNMLCDYPGGPTVVLISSQANSTPISHLIRGHKATLEFDQEGFTITPQDTSPRSARPEKTAKEVRLLTYRKKGAEDIRLHHQNLHAAIRTGATLNCDVMLGYYSTVVAHMGVESFRKRRYLRWNARKQKVEKA